MVEEPERMEGAGKKSIRQTRARIEERDEVEGEFGPTSLPLEKYKYGRQVVPKRAYH